MNRYIIGSLWDRANRNGTNKNFEYLFEGSKRVDALNSRADSILSRSNATLNEAQRTNDMNENVQQQLDNLIIENGNSEAEVVNARGEYPILRDRLDDYDYLLSRPMLNNGRIILPSDFPELPFNIYRKNKYEYTHDASPYNQFDWSNATEIFITNVSVSNRDGLTPDSAIRPGDFRSLFQGGTYGNQTNFILTFIDNTMDSVVALPNGVKNILLRSQSATGKTILGRTKRVGEHTTEWQAYNNIYKLTDNNNHTATDIFNLKQSDWIYGLPKYYKQLDSISAVENEYGTFYSDGSAVYCNPHKGDNIRNLVTLVFQNMFTPNDDLELIIFENIITTSATNGFSFNDCSVYWFDCGFYRGSGQDGFRVSGDNFKVYLLDCVSAYSQKDGFNYGPSSRNNLAVEINSISHSNGLHKRSSGNQTTHSNNGSTAHNGMSMLRVGSQYWDCEGPVVADVNDCYSISIGVKVGNILATTTGVKSAFFVSDESRSGVYPKYVIECEAYGENIVHGINAPQGNAYYMDFTGSTSINNVIKLDGWGD